MKGFRDFEFDLPAALLRGLVSAIEEMESAPLVVEAVDGLPNAQGVYVLLHSGAVVYVGKTDAEAGLKTRLVRHARRVQHRKNLALGSVQFKAVRIYVFTAIALETQLIKYYKNPEWNNSGFGSNDPGRRRDQTHLKVDGYDASFPVDIDRQLDFELPVAESAQRVLLALRKSLPYTFRWETDAENDHLPHVELDQAVVAWTGAPNTVRSILTQVVGQLPPGWQATALAGRVILYRERQDYMFGEIIVRS